MQISFFIPSHINLSLYRNINVWHLLFFVHLNCICSSWLDFNMTLCVPNPPLHFGRHGDVCVCGYSLNRMLNFAAHLTELFLIYIIVRC